MEYLLIGIYIALAIISVTLTFIKYRCVFQFNTFYTLLWAVVGILALINKVGMITPRIEIHYIIIFSIILFNILTFIFCKDKIQKKDINTEESYINYKLIYIFNIIIFIILTPFFIKALSATFNGSFGLREYMVEYTSASSSVRDYVVVFIQRNIPMAIIQATGIIAGVELAKGNKKLLIIALIGQALYMFIYGGRVLLMSFALSFFVAFILLRKSKKIQFKKRYIVILVILLAFIVFLTLQRNMDGYSLWDWGIIYFVGSLSFLELIFQNPASFGLTQLTYGKITFGVILDPIILILKFLGLNIVAPNYEYDKYSQPYVNIGDANNPIWYNNTNTIFYPFIRDFGAVGIIIGISFLAGTSIYLQNKFNKTNKNEYLYLLVFMYGVLFNSSLAYDLYTTGATITIIFIILACTRFKWGDKTIC